MKNSKSWIKIILMVILCHSMVGAAIGKENINRGIVKGTSAITIPDWFTLSFLDFREDAKVAGKSNKHVIIFFHMKGCPYCTKMLEDNFVNSEYQKFIRNNFEVIDINVEGSREVVFNDSLSITEKQLAEVQGVALTPAVLFMSADNQVVMRIDGYRSPEEFRVVLNYVQQKAYYHTDFTKYRAQRINEKVYSLINEPYFTQANNLQALCQQNKTIAVLFEDKTCVDCERFHKEVLNVEKTGELIDQLNLVRLDALSEESIIDINGKKTTPKKWISNLGITYRPSVVFFSPEGKEIERLTGFIRSFHFQSLLSYSLNDQYKKYPVWRGYMQARKEKILQAGRNVDLSQ